MNRQLTLAAAALFASSPLLAQGATGFGISTVVAGGDVLISETSEALPGSVIIFRKAGNAWTERGRLLASDGRADDRFGVAMAADGDLALISATRTGPGTGGGQVYVFRRTRAGAWSEVAKLTADGMVRGDAFGSSVAIHGNVAAVGVPGKDSSRGRVYTFRRDGDTWTQTGMLVSPEPTVGERFGHAVSIRGDRLIVGGPGRAAGTGGAYAFQLTGTEWRLRTRMQLAGMPANSQMGSTVLQTDSLAFIAAPTMDQFSGAVYVFGQDTTGDWQNRMLLRPFNQARNLNFGASMAVDGNDMYIGAPGADRNTGTLYRVRRDTSGNWVDMTAVRAGDTDRSDRFAAPMAAANGVVSVISRGDDFGSATAVVFERDARTGNLRHSPKFWTTQQGMQAVTGRETRCEGRAAQFNCNAVDLMSFLPIADIGGGRGVRLSGVWGWTDPTTNREYALVGRINGTSFVDVTNASNPVYVGDLPMTPGANASSWREIKVYRDHAYITSDGAGNHGMQVFDLTQLRDVRPGSPRTFRPVMTYTRVASAHNIVINEESGFAYATGVNSGGETCGGGLHMIDIREPRNPQFAGCFQDTTTGLRRTGYSHDAQCVIYRGPDTRYTGREICLGSNETAVSIADVTDKRNPVAVSTITYPSVAYTHQGWLTDDHRYFYVNDELDEIQRGIPGTRTMIFDFADLREPVLAGQYVAQVPAIDHNLYVKGNLVFESNYTSGLRVLDITNRTQPREVGFLDTYPPNDDATFNGTWSNYPFFRSGSVIVASIGEGLFVVRPRVDRPVP